MNAMCSVRARPESIQDARRQGSDNNVGQTDCTSIKRDCRREYSTGREHVLLHDRLTGGQLIPGAIAM